MGIAKRFRKIKGRVVKGYSVVPVGVHFFVCWLFLRMGSRRMGTALSGRVPPGAAEDGGTKSDNFMRPTGRAITRCVPRCIPDSCPVQTRGGPRCSDRVCVAGVWAHPQVESGGHTE